MMRKAIFSFVSIFLLFVTAVFSGPPESSEPEIATRENLSFCYAAMEFGGSFDKLGASVQTFVGEFFKQGLVPAGPVLGIYYNDSRQVKPEELKWDIGFVVNRDAEVKAPLKKAEMKVNTAAVYTHTGPYNKLSPVYEKIFKYVEDKGYKILWPVFDRYLNNPKQVKPEELKTEVIVPFEKK
jgi:AraC family transcriptional regulator